MRTERTVDQDADEDTSLTEMEGVSLSSASEKPVGILKRSKSVSFAPETKPPMPESGSEAATTSTTAGTLAAPQPIDGVIGTLEVYKSGAVKMRLGDGIVLDVGILPVCLLGSVINEAPCTGFGSHPTVVPSTCCIFETSDG